MIPRALNRKSLVQGVSYLCKTDPDLARVVSDLGHPPLWARKPGFATLLKIILEQQVSLASAKAVYTKLEIACGQITPESFLTFDDSELKKFGFSRQKTKYGRALSEAILDGRLDLALLSGMEDGEVRKELIKIKGIGPWTADIYLLMALLRPDIWPSGDLALVSAVQQMKNLPGKPAADHINIIAENWKPWRSVAARIAWHDYLNKT
jgi:DNA-3-methyladenine glycosylase II